MADEAHEVAGVEEAASFTELPEGIGDAGEIERHFWRYVLDVECDNLLLQDQEMAH